MTVVALQDTAVQAHQPTDRPTDRPTVTRRAFSRSTDPSRAVAAVVVNWNTRSLLNDAMVNLTTVLGPHDEICVVDNGSHDGSLDGFDEQWPEVLVVRNTDNRGFCIASNQGIRSTTAPYVLLINTDARIGQSSLDALVDHLVKRPDTAIAGPRLAYADGRFQRWTAGRELSLLDAAKYCFMIDRAAARWRWCEGMYAAVDDTTVRTVGWVSSAVMLVRRSVFDTVGLLDESIFLYMDDVDLCHRVRKAGHDVAYVGDVTAIHFMGRSSARSDTAKASPAAIRSMVSWYRRTHGPVAGTVFRLIVASGFALRAALYAAHGIRRPNDRLRARAHLANLAVISKRPKDCSVNTTQHHSIVSHDHRGDLSTDDRHAHEAEVYDEMARHLLATLSEDELRVDPSRIPFPNREHVDYLTFGLQQLGSLQGKRILEVGVGGGTLAAYMAAQGADVTGIDVSEGILALAAKRTSASGVGDRVHLHHSPVENFTDQHGFDGIIGNNVLHHFDLPFALPSIRALLRPNAPAVFCEPVLFVPEAIRKVRYSRPMSTWFPPHTHTPDERSLDKDTIALIERYFDSVDWTPFHVTCRLQHFVELSDGAWNRLERIDRALLKRVPAARHLCRQVVLTLRTPVPDRTPGMHQNTLPNTLPNIHPETVGGLS